MKNLLYIGCLIIPLTFLSCGGEEKETPEKDVIVNEPKEIDACSFINQEAVAKIFNTEMSDPQKGRSQKGDAKKASFSECSFRSVDEGSGIYMSVYIRFTPFKDDYHAAIQNVRNSFSKSGITVTDISGLGEVAFWGGNQLHVFRGDNYYLIITLLGVGDQDEAIEKAKAVVQHVMGNIDSV